MKSYDQKFGVGKQITRHVSRHVFYQSTAKPKIANKRYFKPNGIRYYAFDFTYGSGLFFLGQPTTENAFVPRVSNTNDAYSYLSTRMDQADILATNKFIEELGSVRVNLYDLLRTRRESYNMIADRAVQLFRAVSALKKGRWRQACTILGIKKKRPSQSQFPQQWLEYSYGWAPLLGDMYTIGEDMFSTPSTIVKKSYREDVAIPINHSTGSLVYTGVITGKILATAKAIVTIDSAMLHAANQYGVLNPFAVMWEAVPFSFVVDWFIPIGDYLNQFNATSGLKIQDFSVTKSYVIRQDGTTKPRHWSFTGQMSSSGKQVVKFRRLGAAPVYNFPKITNPLDLSYRRCSYALSLLVMGLQSRSK